MSHFGLDFMIHKMKEVRNVQYLQFVFPVLYVRKNLFWKFAMSFTLMDFSSKSGQKFINQIITFVGFFGFRTRFEFN